MKFDRQQISLQNAYAFGAVMSDPAFCLKLIRLILPDLDIRAVKFADREKVFEDHHHSHGVRLDLYTRDDQGNVYDVEMQVRRSKTLPKRSRYYHSKMDSDNLGRGKDYGRLKGSYVIFICAFDPFGLGLHKYEFQHFCLADKSLALNDGQRTIFLNAKGTANDVSLGLANFLRFVDNKEVKDEYVSQIKKRIDQFAQSQKWRQKYMDNETHMFFHDMDVREETRNEDLTVINHILRWQSEGLSQTQIIDLLKEKFAFSDHDVAKVLS